MEKQTIDPIRFEQIETSVIAALLGLIRNK